MKRKPVNVLRSLFTITVAAALTLSAAAGPQVLLPSSLAQASPGVEQSLHWEALA